METLLEKAIKIISEPYSSWDSFVAAATNFAREFGSLQSKTGWLYVLSSAAIAYLVYRHGKRRGHLDADKSFREVMLPADVYLHRSAIVDYKFVLFDQVVRKFLYVPLLYGLTYFVYLVLSRVLPTGLVQLSPTTAMWVLPVYALIMTDLGTFVGHWLMHRIPFLWPFHEVHHSAEVLTPVTVYRSHPVEDLFIGAVGSVFTALSGALFTSLTDVRLNPLSIFGLHVLTFLFYIVGYQLRHSHVWVSYGPVWSRIFISPAQHQVHHSEAEKHWNKNFGFMFAFWDLMFGTLYVPKQREQIVFGCGADPEEYSTIWRLYFTPFVKSYHVLRSALLRRLAARSRQARELLGTAPDTDVARPPSATIRAKVEERV